MHSLGNIFTYAAAGAMVRFGQRLRADWGQPRIQPALSGSDFVNHGALHDGPAWYVFAGTEGRAVARNIFLDGNTWEDGPSVDKKPFVADLTAGAAVSWRTGGASAPAIPTGPRSSTGRTGTTISSPSTFRSISRPLRRSRRPAKPVYRVMTP